LVLFLYIFSNNKTGYAVTKQAKGEKMEIIVRYDDQGRILAVWGRINKGENPADRAEAQAKFKSENSN